MYDDLKKRLADATAAQDIDPAAEPEPEFQSKVWEKDPEPSYTNA